jgi:hypothetical protein
VDIQLLASLGVYRSPYDVRERIGLYLALKDPTLLERRKKFGPTQKQ